MQNDKKSSNGDQKAPAPDVFGGLSRRDFIRLNLAMFVLAGTSRCRWPEDPIGDLSEFRIVRPADLLALSFELKNLRIEHRRKKPARLKRIRRSEDALLVVRFPGQHILEQAFPYSRDIDSVELPVKSRIAHPSRLFFKIPPELDHVELTFDNLLDWHNLIPMLPTTGRDERAGPSSAERSIIEMPYGLSLLPNETARWVHATQPVTQNGRTELWHTRLTSGNPDKPLIVTIQQPGYTAPDFDRGLTSLTVEDRQQLTGRTAEARTCLTSRMEVRVPSLEPYLDEKRNRLFDLVDPDAPDNLGEIFASARKSDGPPIPMHFDRQADRCGGVAAPSFDVEGLSRVVGPVGDTGPMYAGGRFIPEAYFKTGRASLLGGFPLIDLLLGSDGTKSPAVPNISFIMSRKQPDEKATEKGAKPHWEIGMGLKWGIGLIGAGEMELGPARIVPELDKKTKQSKAKLVLEAKITKTLGQSSESETENRSADPGRDSQDPGSVHR